MEGRGTGREEWGGGNRGGERGKGGEKTIPPPFVSHFKPWFDHR